MRSASTWMCVGLLMIAVALSMTAIPATAQKSAVKRGEGREVTRTDGTRDEVARERGSHADAARGRTSGRADRTSRRGDDERVVVRDGRQERTRTTRRSERQDRDVVVLERGSDDYRTGKGKGRGPKFCQTGEGHPVHGIAWCREKGFGRTSERQILSRRDRDRDVIVVDRDRRTRGVQSGGILQDVLDDL